MGENASATGLEPLPRQKAAAEAALDGDDPSDHGRGIAAASGELRGLPHAEQASDIEHEWLEGVVYAMGATTLEHSRLAGNMHTALNNELRGNGCTVYPEGATVDVADRLGARPDVTLLCERAQTRAVLDKNGKVSAEALMNPVALVEVLSDSTEGYERGKKLGHYRRMASLKEYVLVSQDERLIEVFRPNASGHWALEEEAHAGQTVVIHGATIEVDSICAE